MSQLRSSHGAGLAFVNSLALHQDFSCKLDGSMGAALGFRTKKSNPRDRPRSNHVWYIERWRDS
jgi:hypothetical protein